MWVVIYKTTGENLAMYWFCAFVCFDRQWQVCNKWKVDSVLYLSEALAGMVCFVPPKCQAKTLHCSEYCINED